MNKVLPDERLGAKFRVTENRCVLFNSLTYVYICMYEVCILIFPFYSAQYVGVERDVYCDRRKRQRETILLSLQAC